MTDNPEVVAEIKEGADYVANTPRLMEILEAVAAVYRVGKMDIISFRRFANMVEARDAFYWCARTLTPRSYPEIGQFFGKRDHSTVWAGVLRVTQRFDAHKDRLEQVVKRLGINMKDYHP